MKSKLLLLSLGLLSFIFSYSQINTSINKNNEILFERIFNQQSANSSKEDLYTSASNWFTLKFKPSYSGILVIEDASDTTIIGKGYSKFTHYLKDYEWHIEFAIYIKTQDKFYEIKINQITFRNKHIENEVWSDDFSLNDIPNDYLDEKEFVKLKEKIHQKLDAIVNDFHQNVPTEVLYKEDLKED